MITKILLLTLCLSACATSREFENTETGKATVNPEHLANTMQFGYSQATIVSPNATVIFVAGQIGTNDEGPNDFESQVDRAFNNLVSVLEASGGRVEDVVKITLLIKDHNYEKLQYLVKKRLQVFGTTPPASTLIPVSALALESLEFEIDAIAVASR